MMLTTPWKTYSEDGRKYRIRATYGMDYGVARRHNQEPHFSLTGEIDEQARNNRWMDVGGGQLHNELVKHFPQFREIAHWHLMSPAAPMHCMANAKYWWEAWSGETPARQHDRPLDSFAATIVWGALPGETGSAALGTAMLRPWGEVRDWLEARLPLLQHAFRSDMQAIGVWEG